MFGVVRRIFLSLCILLVGCSERFVAPPAPVDEGSFFVHRVRSPDESLNKILTWYTGTLLCQPIILRFNPYLQDRPVKVGDRIIIPVELVANEYPYGTGPTPQGGAVPNLLMEEKDSRAEPASKKLETFGDEMNPESPDAEHDMNRSEGSQQELIAGGQEGAPEIKETKSEPPASAASPVPTELQADMPPAGLLEEFQGS